MDPLVGAYKRKRFNPPVVLFRAFDGPTEAERDVAERHLVTVRSRTRVTGGDLVIGRYSVLPYYLELQRDLESVGAHLINSHRQHRYAADLQNWVTDLGDLTPQTWGELSEVPDNVGPVVLKGETNSFKHKWSTHMFAADKKAAVETFLRLQDTSIGDQKIYVRKFVPLKTLLVDPVSHQPVTEEFRFFVLDGVVVSGGYYWSNHVDALERVPSPSDVPTEFLSEVIRRIDNQIRFVVIDVAKTESGDWIVVELNDGQMSGLSENDPEVLYKRVKYELWDKLEPNSLANNKWA